MKQLVILASGSGTNFQSILDAIDRGDLPAMVRGVITSRPGIGALQRAEKAGIDTRVIQPGNFSEPSGFARAMIDQISEWKPDLIVCAGYTVHIPEAVVRTWPDRILNIHPSLLPKYGGKSYYGLRVHKAVLEAGESETGCTVHLVDEAYDRGPILAQSRIPVLDGDTAETLAERVLKEEHKLLPSVIHTLLTQNED